MLSAKPSGNRSATFAGRHWPEVRRERGLPQDLPVVANFAGTTQANPMHALCSAHPLQYRVTEA